jgi:zinc D-Ala-D-Ala carboxypeptidase
MLLSAHFTYNEFTFTSHREIVNQLPDALLDNARQTCAMMERVRQYLSDKAQKEIPITCTSGYRCLELNRAEKSSDTSDHLRALAMDWKAPAFGTPYTISLALSLVVNQLDIGQLIHEYGRWIHCGVPKPAKAYNRVITIDRNGTQVGIQRVV